MESYFFEDKKVLEWVDLIIEKLFTICLLGDDRSSEDFEEGTKAVRKIATFLQTLSPLPPETLMEAIIQLIEQRLPEDKVMNHFPSYREELNNMLRIGLGEQFSEQISYLSENIKAIPASSKITLSGGREPYSSTINNYKISINDYYNSQPKDYSSISESDDFSLNKGQFFIDKSEDINNINLSENTELDEGEETSFSELNKDEGEILELRTVGAFSRPNFNENALLKIDQESIRTNIIDNENNLVPNQNPDDDKSSHNNNMSNKDKKDSSNQLSIPKIENQVLKEGEIKAKKIIHTKVPSNGLRLQSVLQQLYPGSKVYWNFSISKYTFFAQVQDLLVYLKSLDQSETNRVINEMSDNGWKILCCTEDDLKFPRRLEREIKTLLRNNKKTK